VRGTEDGLCFFDAGVDTVDGDDLFAAGDFGGLWID
jgi:hypothetical protein